MPEIKVTVQIGKNGLSEETIQEIQKQLKAKKTIRIKYLRSFLDTTDKKEATRLILEKTQAILLEQRGFIITIRKN